MLILTSILSASRKPIRVVTGSKNVTGYGLVPFIGSFIKAHPLFTAISEALANHTGRTFNPLNLYTDSELLFTRLILFFLGLPTLDDVRTALIDPLIRQTIGRIPSASTLCHQEMAAGSICESERDGKLNGRRLEDLQKYDPDAIGSSFFEICNDLLLKDTMRRIHQRKRVKYIVIDVDCTFVKTDGRQKGTAFDGARGANGYFPLLCFLNGELVHIQNAPGATDGRRLLEQVIAELIDKIRKDFPHTSLLPGADAGFNSQLVVDVCEEKGVYYILGYTGNTLSMEVACERIRKRVVGPATAYVRGLPAKLCQAIWPAETFELGDLKPLERPMAFCGKAEGYQSKNWTSSRDVYYRIMVNRKYEIDLRFVQTNIPLKKVKFFCHNLGVAKEYCKPQDCFETKAGARRAIDLYYGLYCDRGNCESRNQGV